MPQRVEESAAVGRRVEVEEGANGGRADAGAGEESVRLRHHCE
jgi:hypothetical protein